MGKLSAPTAEQALTGPAAAAGVTWEPAAAAAVLTAADGYPYFVQEFGPTPTERSYLVAMAADGEGPSQTADIASRMGRTQSNLGPIRAGLIGKGLVYRPEYARSGSPCRAWPASCSATPARRSTTTRTGSPAWATARVSSPHSSRSHAHVGGQSAGFGGAAR